MAGGSSTQRPGPRARGWTGAAGASWVCITFRTWVTGEAESREDLRTDLRPGRIGGLCGTPHSAGCVVHPHGERTPPCSAGHSSRFS